MCSLLSDVELLDDGTVSLDIYLLKITEEVSSVTNHFKKTATAVMVVVVVLEMLLKAIDPVSKDSDLNLGRACVTLVDSVLSDYSLLFFSCHFLFHLSVNFINEKHSDRRVKYGKSFRLVFPKTELYVIRSLFYHINHIL